MLFKALILEKRVLSLNADSINKGDPLLRLEDRIALYYAIFIIVFDPSPFVVSGRLGWSKTRQFDEHTETSHVVEDFRSNVIVVVYGVTAADI